MKKTQSTTKVGMCLQRSSQLQPILGSGSAKIKTKIYIHYSLIQTNNSITDVKKIMKESRDEKKLRHMWSEWHNKCGNKIRKPYEQFVKLSNQAAGLNSNQIIV
jgi:hypothetical protein